MGIRWYGLAYAAGFAAAWFLFERWRKSGWLPLKNSDASSDLISFAIAGTIVGGRLGYCFLYDLHTTLANPFSIFEIWNGGMASHGGVIGLVAASWIYARKNSISHLRLMDAFSIAATPGVFLGRLANFVNGELWGRPSDAAWAVVFPNSPAPLVPRHPSQLYEAMLEGLVLGALLVLAKSCFKKREGIVFASVLVLYPVLRIFVESFREPDKQIGFLLGGWTLGQWLSFAMLWGGLLFFFYLFRKSNNSAL